MTAPRETAAAVSAADQRELDGLSEVTLATVAEAHLRGFETWAATTHDPDDVSNGLRARLHRECITHAGLLSVDVRALLDENAALRAQRAADAGEIVNLHPLRGGVDMIASEHWRLAADPQSECRATLSARAYDPDDERVRVRLVKDDDDLLADAAKWRAALSPAATEAPE